MGQKIDYETQLVRKMMTMKKEELEGSEQILQWIADNAEEIPIEKLVLCAFTHYDIWAKEVRA